jgi:putative membrane protein
MLRRSSLFILTGVFFVAVSVSAQSPTDAASSDLGDFARKAAFGGMTEVELGRLAVERASNARVKEFGQRMIDDHTQANTELRVAAREQGISLPMELDAEHRTAIDRFARLSGPAFDQAYMRDMVMDHEQDVAEFARAAQTPGDSPVKSFAVKALPTLQDHLKVARDVDGQLARGGGGGSEGMLLLTR